MKKLILMITTLSITGCAATYKEPITPMPNASRTIAGSHTTLLRAAKQVLVSEGFQITNADEEAGVISTAPHEMRLTPALADCGTTMGIDYLKDNRTSGKIGYGIIAKDNKLTIKTQMSATYLPSNDSQSITLTCVSRGVLEDQLFAQITTAASN